MKLEYKFYQEKDANNLFQTLLTHEGIQVLQHN